MCVLNGVELTISSKPSEPKDVEVSASAPKATFSFAETMASLNKPREVQQVKKAVEDRPPETEEERKKRLRKEERRKLRVKWKSETNLVETRIFTHEPEEDEGHDQSMRRDVADVKGEGQMLKLNKGVDFEDDEDPAAEPVEFLPWRQPIRKNPSSSVSLLQGYTKYIHSY